MKQFIEIFIDAYVVLCIIGSVFFLGVVYGLADCPNIIEWIKRKLKADKDAREKQSRREIVA